MIFDLLKDLNEDDSFTDKINESSYTQGLKQNNNNNNFYNNFVSCIVSEYDPLYLTIPENERKMYMKKLIRMLLLADLCLWQKCQTSTI